MTTEETLKEIISLLTQSIRDRGRNESNLRAMIGRNEERINDVYNIITSITPAIGKTTNDIRKETEIFNLAAGLRADLESATAKYEAICKRLEALPVCAK